MRTQDQILDDNSLTYVEKAKEIANNIIGDRLHDKSVFSNSKLMALKDYLSVEPEPLPYKLECVSENVVCTGVEFFDDICSGGISPNDYGKVLG